MQMREIQILDDNSEVVQIGLIPDQPGGLPFLVMDEDQKNWFFHVDHGRYKPSRPAIFFHKEWLDD